MKKKPKKGLRGKRSKRGRKRGRGCDILKPLYDEEKKKKLFFCFPIRKWNIICENWCFMRAEEEVFFVAAISEGKKERGREKNVIWQTEEVENRWKIDGKVMMRLCVCSTIPLHSLSSSSSLLLCFLVFLPSSDWKQQNKTGCPFRPLLLCFFFKGLKKSL